MGTGDAAGTCDHCEESVLRAVNYAQQLFNDHLKYMPQIESNSTITSFEQLARLTFATKTPRYKEKALPCIL